jgi:hypothetical protein
VTLEDVGTATGGMHGTELRRTQRVSAEPHPLSLGAEFVALAFVVSRSKRCRWCQ